MNQGPLAKVFWGLHEAFHDSSTRRYKAVDGVVWLLILASLGLVFIELYGVLPGNPSLTTLNHIIVVLFAIEITLRVGTFVPAETQFYELRGWNYARAHAIGRFRFLFLSPMNVIDLICVLEFVHPAFRGLRAVRALRLLRGIQIFRYNSPVAALERAFRDNAALYIGAFGLLFTAVAVGGTSLYMTNQGQNPNLRSIPDGMWWALVTITTVGYGDITPAADDTVGRAIAASLMVFGMFMLALFAGIISNTLLTSVMALRLEQFRMTKTYNHIIICGYNDGARLLLDTLSTEIDLETVEPVIFAPGERPSSVPHDYRWVQGDPTKESELPKGRLAEARAVIVVGQRGLLPQAADANTILTVFTIRRYLKKHQHRHARSKPLYIVGEILDHENVEHAFASGCDEVIETTRLGFSLISHSITNPGTGALLGLLASSDGQNLYVGRIPKELPEDATFQDAVAHLARRGLLVVGVRDQSKKDVLNPAHDRPLATAAGLIYISSTPILPRMS